MPDINKIINLFATYLNSLTGDDAFTLSNMATVLPSSCLMSVADKDFPESSCSMISRNLKSNNILDVGMDMLNYIK